VKVRGAKVQKAKVRGAKVQKAKVREAKVQEARVQAGVKDRRKKISLISKVFWRKRKSENKSRKQKAVFGWRFTTKK
jgi:hypothetical protein